jgi:cell division protease FtsH
VWLSSDQRTVHTRGPILTEDEKAAHGNGQAVIPQDEAARVSDEHPPERIGEVPE